jgi:hypothetical protein
VYREGAGDPEGGGTLYVVNNARSNVFRGTSIPAGQNPELFDELAKVDVFATNVGSWIEVSTNAYIGNILLVTNTYLVLSNNTLFVDSREHHLGGTQKGAGDTNRVDHYHQIQWIGNPSGMVIQFR